MREGAEAVRDAPGLLDQQVDGLGAAVGDPGGVEVGEQLPAPGSQGAAELFAARCERVSGRRHHVTLSDRAGGFHDGIHPSAGVPCSTLELEPVVTDEGAQHVVVPR